MAGELQAVMIFIYFFGLDAMGSTGEVAEPLRNWGFEMEFAPRGFRHCVTSWW